MFTVDSVDRYIERYIGRDSVDNRSIIGRESDRLSAEYRSIFRGCT